MECTDIGISIWNQYACPYFFMLDIWYLAWGKNRDFMDDDSVFLYRCFGRIYQYIQDGQKINEKIGSICCQTGLGRTHAEKIKRCITGTGCNNHRIRVGDSVCRGVVCRR